jgi:DNA-binding NarL/FixJ family response regulator
VVDDHAGFRAVLRSLLNENYPYIDVTEAGSVQETLRSVEELPPDLIFIDIRLPDGSGLTLTRTIKASRPQTPVVVITSHDLPEYRQAANRDGASYFMAKQEFSASDIQALVETAVAEKHPHIFTEATRRSLGPRQVARRDQEPRDEPTMPSADSPDPATGAPRKPKSPS